MNSKSALWIVIFRVAVFGLCLAAGLAAQAAFSNALLAAKTTFNGLLSDEGAVPSHTGYFKLDVSRSGHFTGRLLIGQNRAGFSGRFNDSGKAFVRVRVKTGEYEFVQTVWGTEIREIKELKWILVLQLTNGLYDITGQILPYHSTGWSGIVTGRRAEYTARANPAPQAGRYTVILPVGLDGRTGPSGDAWGALTVDEAGHVVLQGGLADNSRFIATSVLSADGVWPLFVPFDRGRGMLVGWLQFTNSIESELVGQLNWVRLRDPDTSFYPAGFTNQTGVLASSYLRPAVDQSALNLTNAVLILSGGDLTSGLTNSLSFSTLSVLKGSSDSSCVVRFSLPTGLFQGWAEVPETRRFLPISGGVLQNRNAGFGYFTDNSRGGKVTIEEKPSLDY